MKPRNWIFRAERNFEHNPEPPPWLAYCPGEDRKNLRQHIKFGSENSRFLSTSKSFSISAFKHAVGTYNSQSEEGIVREKASRRNVMLIDWNLIPKGSSIDCTDIEILIEEYGFPSNDTKYPVADREVVIIDEIPSEAARIVPPMISDFLFVLDQKNAFSYDEAIKTHSEEDFDEFFARQISQIEKKINSIDIKLKQIQERMEKERARCFSRNKPYIYKQKDRDTIKRLQDEKKHYQEEKNRTIARRERVIYPYISDVICESIFEDNGQSLMRIINQIEFTDYEKEFIQYYYENMDSMTTTANNMGVEIDVACGIRAEIVRKISRSREFKQDIVDRIKRKYEKTWMIEETSRLFESGELEEFVFPIPGQVASMANCSFVEKSTIGTGLRSKRQTKLPYGVTVINGELTPIYASLRDGQAIVIEQQIGERLVGKTSLEERDKVGDGIRPIRIK